jgi:hypothetical protein
VRQPHLSIEFSGVEVVLEHHAKSIESIRHMPIMGQGREASDC